MSVKDKIAAIDAKNVSLAEAIRKNHSERNSLVPVSSLSVELLCRIFRGLQDSLQRNSEGSEDPSSPWMVVTRICHGWRMAALGDSQLWSKVLLGPSYPWEQTERVLRRSRGVPISVEVKEKLNSRHLDIVSTILPQAHRLRSLTITGDPQVANYMQQLRYSSAPLLQELVLKNNRTQVASTQRHTQSTVTIVNPAVHMVDLLTGGAPQLRLLELQSLTLPWSSSLFRGLTTLKVQVPAPDYFPGTPHDFFAALKSMPGLEVLIMETCFSDTMKNFRSNRHVALPKLTTLRLKTSILHCVTILMHLSIPLSSSVTLMVNNGPDSSTPAGGRDLMTALHSAWLSDPLSPVQSSLLDGLGTSPNSPRILRSLVVSHVENSKKKDVQIRGFFRELEFGDHGFGINSIPSHERANVKPGGNPAVAIRISPVLVDELLSSEKLLLDHLLWFMATVELRQETWDRFAILPSLESVLLNDATAFGFTSALDGRFFSNLRNIAFSHVDFGHDNYGDEPPPNENPIWLELLAISLDERLEHDSKPIQRLDLNNCINIFEDQVSELKGLVSDVRWDGREIKRDEDDIRPRSQCTCYGVRCQSDCYA